MIFVFIFGMVLGFAFGMVVSSFAFERLNRQHEQVIKLLALNGKKLDSEAMNRFKNN